MNFNLNDKIEKLQNKPYEDRVRILWTVVVIVGIILLVLWVLSLKNTFSGLDTKSLINTNTGQNTTEASTQFASVERVELGENLKIYFNINNTTDDILNISKLENINLVVNGQTVKPKSMNDRQGAVFVQKVLSHTQNFGTLTFPATDSNQAELIFDQMFFENNQSSIFKQTMELDLDKLNKDSNLRN